MSVGPNGAPRPAQAATCWRTPCSGWWIPVRRKRCLSTALRSWKARKFVPSSRVSMPSLMACWTLWLQLAAPGISAGLGTVHELNLSEPEQVLGMVHTFGGALSRHFPVFAAFNVNWSCRPLASQESGAEIPSIASHPNQDQFLIIAPSRCRFIRRGVEKPLGP